MNSSVRPDPNVFVSTGGFAQLTAAESTALLVSGGIQNIELSGGKFSEQPVEELRALAESARFQIHNYFPPPRDPFVLNVASFDDGIAERSMEHVTRAVDICASLEIERYSFHAGFLIDPSVGELGRAVSPRVMNLRERSIDLFVGRVEALASLAATRGVSLLIENNVLSTENARAFGGNPLLMCNPAECRTVMARMPRNVQMLLDVGHLKVSASSLNFDARSMFEECGEWIAGYHLSDNDGLNDSNDSITDSSWFWPYLKPSVEYIAIEIYRATVAELRAQCSLAETILHAHSA